MSEQETVLHVKKGAVYLRLKARTKANMNVSSDSVNNPNWIINVKALDTLTASPPSVERTGSDPKRCLSLVYQIYSN